MDSKVNLAQNIISSRVEKLRYIWTNWRNYVVWCSWIWGFEYQVILLMNTRDPTARLCNTFLGISSEDSVEGCWAACAINYIWMEGRKSQRGLLWQAPVLKQAFFVVSEWEQKTKEKTLSVIRSQPSDQNAWVRIHIWGSNCDIVLNILFLHYITWFLFLLRLFSQQIFPPSEQFQALKKQLEWEKEA